MMCQYVPVPGAGLDMSVYLCRFQVFVSEHLLYRPEVRTFLYQMCCERVAEGVRRNAFGDACCKGQFLYSLEDRDSAQRIAVPVDEDCVTF